MKHRTAILAALCMALASCSDDEVPTYRVAADDVSAEPAVPEKPLETETTPPLRWSAPEEWKVETPGELQIALYTLGTGTTVSVSKFPGDAGGILANVNRWRQQIGLGPAPEEGGDIIALESGDSRAKWFDLRGASESILAAIVPAGDGTWFFKLTAPNNELEDGRPGFISLLKSIEIGGISEPLEKPGINLEVPEGWEKIPSTEMRVASFRIPSGGGGIDGDVSVIPLQGDGGSDLENVNRWRAQLRLPPLESDTGPALGETKEGKSGPFLLTHMVSEETLFSGGRHGAISTAILRKGGFTWFFKIAGEAEMVQANREKFEALVSSALIP